jgi:hypothetical protein
MKMYAVNFKQVKSTQGNWSGTVEPTVLVTARTKVDARKLAVAAIRNSMKTGNRQIKTLKLMHIKEFKTFQILDWQESGDPGTE